MAEKFRLDIVTPAGVKLSAEVEEVTAPGADGEFGVLFGHTNYITTLKAGKVTYKTGTETGSLVVSRGYAEVFADKTNLLVDFADKVEDLDADGVKDELSDAEEALSKAVEGTPEYARAAERLEHAKAKAAAIEGTKAAH